MVQAKLNEGFSGRFMEEPFYFIRTLHLGCVTQHQNILARTCLLAHMIQSQFVV